MKVAILSESSADEAAVRVLVDALIGGATEVPARPRLQSRGWPGLMNVLPTIIGHLHYRTDCEALVVVCDSDQAPLHRAEVAIARATALTNILHAFERAFPSGFGSLAEEIRSWRA